MASSADTCGSCSTYTATRPVTLTNAMAPRFAPAGRTSSCCWPCFRRRSRIRWKSVARHRTKKWILLSTIRRSGGRDGVSRGTRPERMQRSRCGKPPGCEARMRCGSTRTSRRTRTTRRCSAPRGRQARGGPEKTRIAGPMAHVGLRIRSDARVTRSCQRSSNGRSPSVRPV